MAPWLRSAASRPPLPLLLAFVAALLVGGQPLALALVPASAMGDRSGMGTGGRGGDVGPEVAVVPTAGLAPGARAAPALERSGLDDQATIAGMSGYRWPLEHARITQAFGPSSGGSFMVDGQAFHDGLDLATFCGDRVRAAHAGVVIAAGRHTDDATGWVGDLAAYHARLDEKQAWGSLAIVIVIDDGNGFRSIYVHLARVTATVGQVVNAGDVIGFEGATGYASGCHLHYGLFNPDSSGRFQTDPEVVARTLAPVAVVARIDPLLVLPPLAAGDITWGWGARDGT